MANVLGKVYYSLDIKNDTNEAMQAKDYFGSDENLGLDNRHPVQADENELVYHDFADGADSAPKMEVTPGLGIHQPQAIYRFGPQIQDPHEESAMGGGVVETLEDPHPVQASYADFYKYMFTDGNWTDLFATAAGWMLLDFTCAYLLHSLHSL